MRVEEAKRDLYRRRAKVEGYRSRAAYKLLQINKKYRIIKPGDKVLDVGCAPGGWLQVASDIVGQRGFVLGVDISQARRIDRKNVAVFQDDITSPGFTSRLAHEFGKGRADCVLSDLSPRLSGIWDMDHFKQVDLCHSVIDLLPEMLSIEGTNLMKAFHGSELDGLTSRLKECFSRVEISKPEASRNESSEIYFVSMGFIGKVPSRHRESQKETHQSESLEDLGGYGWQSDRLK